MIKKIAVTFILSYLRFFAKNSLKKNKPTIIGIAGSVGKSSTKEALYAILKDHFKTKFTYGNSETGVPLGILGINIENFSLLGWLKILLITPFQTSYLKGTEFLIVEMGTDDPNPPKNMEYLLTIVKPDIALFLNTSAAHTMQFEKALTEEEKLQPPLKKIQTILEKMAHEDGKIITKSNCKTAIYCTNNIYTQQEIETYKKDLSNTQFFTFGITQENDISYGKHEVTIQKTTLELFFDGQPIHLAFENYVLPLEYREVFAAAILAALKVGLSIETIATSLQKNFTLPKGRASIFSGINESIIIDSTYNASRPAVEAFLELSFDLKKQTGRPLIFVFGDMRELGDEAKQEHEAVLKKVIKEVDYLYCVGQLTKKYLIDSLQNNQITFGTIKAASWFKTSEELGIYLQNHLPPSALILFKGSQNEIFLEESIKPILLKKEDQQKLCRQESFWNKSTNKTE